VAWPRFQEQHIEAPSGELLGHDRAAAAGADDNDVAHQPSTFVRPW
jgi:hypothetical protein